MAVKDGRGPFRAACRPRPKPTETGGSGSDTNVPSLARIHVFFFHAYNLWLLFMAHVTTGFLSGRTYFCRLYNKWANALVPPTPILRAMVV